MSPGNQTEIIIKSIKTRSCVSFKKSSSCRGVVQRSSLAATKPVEAQAVLPAAAQEKPSA